MISLADNQRLQKWQVDLMGIMLVERMHNNITKYKAFGLLQSSAYIILVSPRSVMEVMTAQLTVEILDTICSVTCLSVGTLSSPLS